MTAPRFALLGAAGYVASRRNPNHLDAIKAVGGDLVAVCDPSDSVGFLDGYGWSGCEYHRAFETFDRSMERMKREGRGIDWLTVCSPNYLHDAHCRAGLRWGADVICEKPVAIKPHNLRALAEYEQDWPGRIWPVLQLREHPAVRELISSVDIFSNLRRIPYDVTVRYITPRGLWYRASWKGDEAKSGGLVVNIGVHLFDLLIRVFGEATELTVREWGRERCAGFLRFKHARAWWHLSIEQGARPERTFTVDGKPLDLSTHFEHLHETVYRRALAGTGWGVLDALPSLELIENMKEVVR